MSAVPRGSDRANATEADEPGWQKRQGLTLREAEDLLDQLEASGVGQREVRIKADGVTVRWRATWPRLLAE